MKKFIVGCMLAFVTLAAHAAPIVNGALNCLSSSNEVKNHYGVASTLHNSCDQPVRVVVCVAHYPSANIHDNNSLRGYWGCSVNVVPAFGTESNWTPYPTVSPSGEWIYRTLSGCRVTRPDCDTLVNKMVHRLTGN